MSSSTGKKYLQSKRGLTKHTTKMSDYESDGDEKMSDYDEENGEQYGYGSSPAQSESDSDRGDEDSDLEDTGGAMDVDDDEEEEEEEEEKTSSHPRDGHVHKEDRKPFPKWLLQRDPETLVRAAFAEPEGKVVNCIKEGLICTYRAVERDTPSKLITSGKQVNMSMHGEVWRNPKNGFHRFGIVFAPEGKGKWRRIKTEGELYVISAANLMKIPFPNDDEDSTSVFQSTFDNAYEKSLTKKLGDQSITNLLYRKKDSTWSSFLPESAFWRRYYEENLKGKMDPPPDKVTAEEEPPAAAAAADNASSDTEEVVSKKKKKEEPVTPKKPSTPKKKEPESPKKPEKKKEPDPEPEPEPEPPKKAKKPKSDSEPEPKKKKKTPKKPDDSDDDDDADEDKKKKEAAMVSKLEDFDNTRLTLVRAYSRAMVPDKVSAVNVVSRHIKAELKKSAAAAAATSETDDMDIGEESSTPAAAAAAVADDAGDEPAEKKKTTKKQPRKKSTTTVGKKRPREEVEEPSAPTAASATGAFPSPALTDNPLNLKRSPAYWAYRKVVDEEYPTNKLVAILPKVQKGDETIAALTTPMTKEEYGAKKHAETRRKAGVFVAYYAQEVVQQYAKDVADEAQARKRRKLKDEEPDDDDLDDF